VRVLENPPNLREWPTLALRAFDTAVRAGVGFRARAGQRRMAEQVAHTLSKADLGKLPEDGEGESVAPLRSIAVIQAGTGVGKSLAYGAPAMALALARSTRVVISTATVALQEQLVHKDLPQLATLLVQETPVRIALAKGRGRYVCKLKLERFAGGDLGEDSGSLDGDLFPNTKLGVELSPHEMQARIQWYNSMANALASGHWDGDRDSLHPEPLPERWIPVAAEAHTCTGKYCPLFNQCTYYERRKELVAAHVIVVNHDLLLSSIGARLLPELDNCLLLLDEAHHLPTTALNQFACEAELSQLAWIERLASRTLRVGQLLEVEELSDISQHATRLRNAVQQLERQVMEHYGQALRVPPRNGFQMSTCARAPAGILPDALLEPLKQTEHHARGFLKALRATAEALRNAIRDQATENTRQLSMMYAQIGTLAPRLEGLHGTVELLLQTPEHGDGPIAKWFTLEAGGRNALRAHASPVLPGAALHQHFWSGVRAAVVTSATLTSCGSFDFFLRESGLTRDDAVTTLEVPSPFDYARQGTLISHATQTEPRDAQAFTHEMVHTLLEDLAQVTAGALVLFTSREQMRQATEALHMLPISLQEAVLVQGSLPRTQLLAQHRKKVQAGKVSILFGLQSFGEGLDLPGPLCESLFITKLPFSPPDAPVDEARAEWLRSNGGNPFNELVVPATGIRLAQWVGRAIRSENDVAHVYCYDKRLTSTSYGKRLLQGLPAFTLKQRTT